MTAVTSEVIKTKITQEDIDLLQASFSEMNDEQKVKANRLLKLYKKQIVQKTGKETFLDFIQHVYPGYIIGEHHRKLAQIFEDIANGKKKREIGRAHV